MKKSEPSKNSVARIRGLEAICDAFESGCQAGSNPPIEQLLQKVDEKYRPALLRDLVEIECCHREQRGEHPLAVEYVERFPKHAKLIKELFHNALTVSQVAGSTGVTKGPNAPQVQATEFPGYKVLEELGRGGMGVVYKARQIGLNRMVALKVILDRGHSDRESVARFRREADAVARLQHPNIVQIHEIGKTNGGVPYFSLEYVRGGSLDRLLAGTPQLPKLAARAVEVLARAVHAAHECGIVHRDLKPANVLIGSKAKGTGLAAADLSTLKVADFGLAKHLDSEELHTRSGAVMGSPSYMAPEQASGRGHDVGPVTDVYALGAILYEMLTGRPPFKAATVPDTLQQVNFDEPVRPTRLQPRTPRELEIICLKCLRKEQHNRYASAAELADDLRRWQAGEPIRARPVGRVERLRKWAKRRPALAGVYALVLLAIMLGLGGGSVAFLWQRAEQAFQAADKAGQRLTKEKSLTEQALQRESEAKKREAELREKLAQLSYVQNINLIKREWEGGNSIQARTWLDNCDTKRRGWEWFYLKHLIHSELFTLQGHTDSVEAVAFSPDGSRIVSGSLDQTVKIWDAHNGQELLMLRGHGQGGYRAASIAFSPDGRRLATSSFHENSVVIWDAFSGQELFKLGKRTAGVCSVAFSPFGNLLACGCADKSVQIWDASTGKELRTFWEDAPVSAVAFSPDGSQLATGVTTSAVLPGVQVRLVRVWNVNRGEVLFALPGHINVYSVAFSPDGSQLVTASDVPEASSPAQSSVITIWDLSTQQELRKLQVPSWVSSVAFSPDGSRVACGTRDKTVNIWDVRTGEELLTLHGHVERVSSIAFSPDGTRLVSASSDKVVKLWDITNSHHECLTLRGHEGFVESIAFNRDGSRLASGSIDHGTKIWDVATGRELLALSGNSGELQGASPLGTAGLVAFSPDGRRVARASPDKSVKLYCVNSGQELLALRGHSEIVSSVAFSPDGNRIASGSSDKTVKIWNASGGEELLTLHGHSGGVTSVAFIPRGNRLASGSWDGTLKIWDSTTGRELFDLRGHTAGVEDIATDSDGRHLASGSSDRTVKIWNAVTGEELWNLRGHAERVRSVAFSADGKSVASGSLDKFVMIWDVNTGQHLLSLKDHNDGVDCLEFSPDGKHLAAGGSNWVGLDPAHGNLTLWETQLHGDIRSQRWRVWRQQQVQLSEKSGAWFAAVFHLDQLAASSNDVKFQRWRELAFAKLQQKQPKAAALIRRQKRQQQFELYASSIALFSPSLNQGAAGVASSLFASVRTFDNAGDRTNENVSPNAKFIPVENMAFRLQLSSAHGSFRVGADVPILGQLSHQQPIDGCTIQTWIAGLGPDGMRKSAVGGWVIQEKTGEGIYGISKIVSTTGFSAGKYRYYVNLVRDNKTLALAEVDFDLVTIGNENPTPTITATTLPQTKEGPQFPKNGGKLLSREFIEVKHTAFEFRLATTKLAYAVGAEVVIDGELAHQQQIQACSLQTWIARLGSDASLPLKSALRGADLAYAAGGWTIDVKSEKGTYRILKKLATAGFPEGKYRYIIELRNDKQIFASQGVLFELAGPNDTPTQPEAKIAVNPRVKEPDMKAVGQQKAVEELKKLAATLGFKANELTNVSFFRNPNKASDKTLALLKDLPTIEELNLDDSPVTDAGIEHLAGLTKLKVLVVKSKNITDRSVSYVSGLKELRTLVFYNGNITDAGLVHVLGMSNLETLNLYNTKISDQGLVLLHGLTNLRQLYVFGTGVTAQGARQFERAMPNLKVIGR